MIREYLEKILNKQNLSLEESKLLMNKIITGKANDTLISALLIALKSKGESPSEIAGFILSMREHSIKVDHSMNNIIDVCGTGGDSSGTFNISTAAAFVIAGAGIKVAKHGNRAISSKSGSSDVLKELGINNSFSPNQAKRTLQEIGITFMFAPIFHPAMKYVANVRKELKMKTIFNLLGPLTNPASTKSQVIGTYNLEAAKKLAKATDYLDMKRISFVCTDNKYDEVILNNRINVIEYNSDEPLKEYVLNHDSFGFDEINIETIKGSTPEENARIILSIIERKKKSPAYNVVVSNAALGLYSAGYSTDLIECKEAAEESIQSGKAFGKIEELRNFEAA